MTPLSRVPAPILVTLALAACNGGAPSPGAGLADSGAVDAAPDGDGSGAVDAAPDGNDGSALDGSPEAGAESGADAGPSACPHDESFTPPGSFPVPKEYQGECSAADIVSFIQACGDNGTPTTCAAWQSANGITACGTCVVDPTNAGAALIGAGGTLSPNVAACIALTDPTHGAACAAAMDAVTLCEDLECSVCAPAPPGFPILSFESCVNEVSKGSCGSYSNTMNNTCATDFSPAGGAYFTCAPGATTEGNDPTWLYLLNLFCGSGDDAGPGQ